jgi:thiosulfate/3-mercaptopyruvate sulfurtransferase
MSFQTIIDPTTVQKHLGRPDWIIVDCRFDLARPEVGRQAYERGHIPGAVYAHLNDELSGPPLTDCGRHPLPSPDALITLFSRLGIDRSKQVLAYDDSGGAIAARLWWMLGYMGHADVAVLDGGWPLWLESGRPVSTGRESNPPAEFSGHPQTLWLVLLDDVQNVPLLVDSRAPERYRGEIETIDPVAGHIPGAINYPYSNNLAADGRFLPTEQLRQQFSDLLGSSGAAEAAFYCGSGVTACHNLLTLAHAEMGRGRLYVGSWSEWCADPERPISTGTESHAN